MPAQVIKAATSRPASIDLDAVRRTVSDVIAGVRAQGDVAVRQYSEKFDNWSPETFELSPERIEEIVASVPEQVITDIVAAQANVRAFAERQLESLAEFEVETIPGVFLGQKNIPVQAVGAYIPGGRYPLVASAHMTVLTAKVAGVPSVTACTPPIRGEVPAATIAAMHHAGADRILLLGGVQAVAGMAVGTESIQRVDLIAGPGNAYVAESKRQLFGEVGIDLLAGPTEILVLADEHADPFVVAVDLLSQAEHGPDSPAVLVTTSREVADQALAHIERILPDMPTKDFAEPAWNDHGQIIVVDSIDEIYAVADELAFEHVEVLTENPREALDTMRNYGAMFLGEGTCVSYGDKVIGTNHTLPTKKAGRYTGGLWVGKFLKTHSYQRVVTDEAAAMIGAYGSRLCMLEGFVGHAEQCNVRVRRYGGRNVPYGASAE